MAKSQRVIFSVSADTNKKLEELVHWSGGLTKSAVLRSLIKKEWKRIAAPRIGPATIPTNTGPKVSLPLGVKLKDTK